MLLLFLVPSVSAVDRLVPQQYSTIQEAIDAASTGDRILVSPGTYPAVTNLNKDVILQATTFDPINPRNNTTIISGGTTTINIPSGVSGSPEVRGFKVHNTSSSGKNLIGNSQFDVEYSWFTGGGDQVSYELGSGGVNRGNVYENAGDDCIDSDNQIRDVLIENNTCTNPNDDGIEMRFFDDSIPNIITVTVRGNKLESAGVDGFQLIDYNNDTNRRVIFERNLFLNNGVAGVGFLPNGNTNYPDPNNPYAHPMREEVQITNNTFVGNRFGVSGGSNALVLNNIFLNSTRYGLLNVTGSSYVARNVFFGNILGNSSGTNNNSAILGNPNLNASYIPQVGSVAIDAGLASYTWNNLFRVVNFLIPPDQYAGGAPDDGWKETGFTGPTITEGPTSTPVPTQPPTPTIDGTRVSTAIAALTDDAEEDNATGAVQHISTDLEFTTDGALTQTVGMRFAGVSIPRNAPITSAYLEFIADEAQSVTTNLVFHGEASDNPTTFSESARNISLRPSTTASVAWNNVPAWTIGQTYTSPNLAPIIQEIVNRSGWASSNSVVFKVTGTGHRTAYSFNGSNANPVRLVVIYGGSGGGTSTPTPIVCPPLPANPGTATFTINTAGAGTYNVWTRLKAADTANNSYFMQVDDTCAAIVGDSNSISATDWTWVNYTDGTPTSLHTATLSQGAHTIKAMARENNVKIDRILFLDDNCIPTGFGDNCIVPPTPTLTPSPTQFPTITPTPTMFQEPPTPTPNTTTFTSTNSITPSGSVPIGSTVRINTRFTNISIARTVSVDIEVYAGSTLKMKETWTGEAFTAGASKTYLPTWRVLQGEPTGEHTVRVKVYSGSTVYHQNNAAASFNVVSGTFTAGCLGDLNADGLVSSADFTLVRNQARPAGRATCALYNPAGLCMSDIASPTNTINDQDGNKLQDYFGQCVFPAASPTPISSTSITPIDDSWVEQANPTATHGTSTTLSSDNTPVEQALMKFDLGVLAGRTISSAKLRMYVTDASASTQVVKPLLSNAWNEGTVNYSNQPGRGAQIATFPGGTTGTWREVDITSFITANIGQTISLAIDSTGSDGFDFSSGDGTNPVHLLVE